MSGDRVEYRGKVFKSGNSLALRLPKALGVEEGTEMRLLREAPMSFRMEPVDAPKRKIDTSGFVGKAPWLKPLTPDDREMQVRDLPWHVLEGRDDPGE